jgi:hypothetical protein
MGEVPRQQLPCGLAHLVELAHRVELAGEIQPVPARVKAIMGIW